MTHPSNLAEKISTQIAPLLPQRSSILIGLSGGVDSVALLHLLRQLAGQFSWQLSALHVHHGISQNADSWAEFCTELCVRHRIPLRIEHVNVAPLRAQGIEAAARKLRYAAFANQACDFVALAHHTDDQAETLLMQLLRGAGVRGAAAMPMLTTRAGSPSLLRPLLHCSRQEILDYAAKFELPWVDDESNASDNYPRNFLRHRILPVLAKRFPAYRDTLSRSAQHFAETSKLLDDLARLDAENHAGLPLVVKEGHAITLAVSCLKALPWPRAKNLLRYFLHERGALMPQAAQLDNMLQQLCNAREDATVCIEYGDWQARRYQNQVHVLRTPDKFDRNLIVAWHGEPELEWPALNTRLVFSTSQGVGISLEKLRRAPVTLRLRIGGETLCPKTKSAIRTLKNLLQEHRIPPWQRDRLPLLHCGDDLVCVPGVAIAAEYQASADEAGVQIALYNMPTK